MNFLNLSDLRNPDKTTGILLNDTTYIAVGENQGFQETKGRYELWEKLKDGRLLMVIRWNKKSVLATYIDKEL
jgi:hypothetical protein